MAKRKRTKTGKFLPALFGGSKTPAKRKKAKISGKKGTRSRRPRSAKRNPPTGVIRETMSVGVAAIVGGLAAHAAVKVLDRIASPGVADVSRVLAPLAIGMFATQIDSPHAQAIAAGAIGVAGAAVASSIADAIAKPNPPFDTGDLWLDNPPPPDQLTQAMNQSYRDGITALLNT